MTLYAFNLGQPVRFTNTTTCGVVVARSESLRSQPQYLVEFVKDAEIKEQWVFETQLAYHNSDL